ncbi:hypothetical protein [Bacillus atrophaeus]|uniref:hypothetical protein n=1 Tax=Bacillus atrophaeus TaxID=1452 RepID=UPI002282C716|nr:hypothetical protein [Bacillus atrophaeus]MCY8932124.1 hypothetical protein [Bacillus atrophaeus]MCY8943037.1 hypothetical protein [Bacillus atrophaeus]
MERDKNYQWINPQNIINYAENPRHEIGVNEKDTLKKLITKVGSQYMYNLAVDIIEHGLLGSVLPTVVYNDSVEKYIVYEGNRRIACIKILNDPTLLEGIDSTLKKKIEKLKKQNNNRINEIYCYITSEEEAFFIMKRTHSGEDKGRGPKSWTAREKSNFDHRQTNSPKISLIITDLTEKYLKINIIDKMGFTTIERIFNNRMVKKALNLDVKNINSFTKNKIILINNLVDLCLKESLEKKIALTRLFNKSRDIEDFILPNIEILSSQVENENQLLESKKDKVPKDDVQSKESEQKDGVDQNKKEPEQDVEEQSKKELEQKDIDESKKESEQNDIKEATSFIIKRKNVNIKRGNSYNLFKNIKVLANKEEILFSSPHLKINNHSNVSFGNSVGDHIIYVRYHNYQKSFTLSILDEVESQEYDYRLLVNPTWIENLNDFNSYDKKIKEILFELDRISSLGYIEAKKFKLSTHLLVLSLLELAYIRHSLIVYNNPKKEDKKGLPLKIMEIVDRMKEKNLVDNGTHSSIARLINGQKGKGHLITSLNGIKHADVYSSTSDLYDSFERLRPYIDYCLLLSDQS